MKRHELTAAMLILAAAALLLVTGCGITKATKDKAVNVGTSGAGLDINTAPDVTGGMGLRLVAGSFEATYQSVPKDCKNSVQVKIKESSAWYCASMKDRTATVTIMSESPIVIDLTPLLTGQEAAQGEQLSQTSKVAAAVAPVVAGVVTK